MMAGWRIDAQAGEDLTFERCKGGYFSTDEAYTLKVVGKTETGAGKNLLNIADMELGKYNYGTGEPEPSTNQFRTKTPIVLPEGTDFLALSNNKSLNCRLFFYDETQRFISTVTVPCRTAAAVPSSAVYVHVITGTLSGGQQALEENEYQMEVGENATAYEPYGKGVQCVRAGASITCGNTVILPRDLQEGDMWMPTLGKIVRADGSVESVDVQPICAQAGTAVVTQEGEELSATLSATMLVRR